MELSGICQLQCKKQLLDPTKSDAVYHALIKMCVEAHLQKEKTNKNNKNKQKNNNKKQNKQKNKQKKTTTKNNNIKPNTF